jgi:signal transduction histidine kinase
MITLPQLLLNELSPNSPQRETIELILQSGRRAAALVDDMLTMSRCARASFEPLSWNRAVESYFCSGEYQHLLQQNPVVQIEHKLDGQLKLCSGAELHMSKILIHLVNNAVASIVGPGSVVVQTTQQYLPIPPDDTLGNSFSGDTVVVSISDSGCGIEIEDVNQIFEPFYMRKKFGRSGTGLELTLVRQCVLDMGGAIAVASKPGGGCTFKLYFPAARIIDMRPSPQRINAS